MDFLIGFLIALALAVLCIFGIIAGAEASKQSRNVVGWFFLGLLFNINAFLALKISNTAYKNGHDINLWSTLGIFFPLPAFFAFETGLNAENKQHDFDCWAIMGFFTGIGALIVSCFLQAYTKNEREGVRIVKTISGVSSQPTTTQYSNLINKTTVVKKVVNTWDCPKCGETNRYDALKCINCYTDKPKDL